MNNNNIISSADRPSVPVRHNRRISPPSNSDIPELSEIVLAEQQESLLKRRSSWRKFKDTVVGWVSGNNAPPVAPEIPNLPGVLNVPSPSTTPVGIIISTTTSSLSSSENRTIYRSQSSTSIINSNSQITENASNSYSSVKKLGKTPPSPGIEKQQSLDEKFIIQKSNNELPKIVITYEDKSPKPIRKLSRQESTPSPTPSPKIHQNKKNSTDNQDSSHEDLKKKIAVAKIKQAIFSMNDFDVSLAGSAPINTPATLTEPSNKSVVRRHSDIGPITPPSKHRTTPDSPIHSNPPLPGDVVERRSSTTSGLSRSNSARTSSKMKPMIWDHFDPVPNNSVIGKCKTCKMTVSCKYNTGQFVRHLQLTHKDVYRKYQTKMDSQWTKSVIEKNLK